MQQAKLLQVSVLTFGIILFSENINCEFVLVNLQNFLCSLEDCPCTVLVITCNQKVSCGYNSFISRISPRLFPETFSLGNFLIICENMAFQRFFYQISWVGWIIVEKMDSFVQAEDVVVYFLVNKKSPEKTNCPIMWGESFSGLDWIWLDSQRPNASSFLRIGQYIIVPKKLKLSTIKWVPLQNFQSCIDAL